LQAAQSIVDWCEEFLGVKFELSIAKAILIPSSLIASTGLELAIVAALFKALIREVDHFIIFSWMKY